MRVTPRVRSSNPITCVQMERGDQAGMATIAARKQTLRDIPQTLNLSKAEALEDLRALWPQGLAPLA
jgi:hypothetical protein